MGKFPDVPSNYNELEGECYYKSGWVEPKWPGGMLSFTKPKGPEHCWLRYNNYGFYIYNESQYWYNWKRSGNPEEDAGFLNSMADAMPDFKMPSLPGMPDLSMPSMSMPDMSMPSVSMPSMSMPSVGMPSMSAPSLGKMPKKKKFKTGNTYIIHAYLNKDATYKRSGKTFTFTLGKCNLYFESGTEEKKKYKFAFNVKEEKQADSWEETLKENSHGLKAE